MSFAASAICLRIMFDLNDECEVESLQVHQAIKQLSIIYYAYLEASLNMSNGLTFITKNI